MLPRPTLAALVAAAVLLTGCSDDDADGPGSGGATSADSSAADTLVRTGIDQLEAGDDRAARTTFDNVLALDPGNLYALYNLGLIAQNAGRDQKALEYYDQALGVKPDYVPALYNKAIVLEASDLEESVRLYRQVLGLDDRMAAAHMRLGFALVHLGEKDEGEDHLEEGITDLAVARVPILNMNVTLINLRAPALGQLQAENVVELVAGDEVAPYYVADGLTLALDFRECRYSATRVG